MQDMTAQTFFRIVFLPRVVSPRGGASKETPRENAEFASVVIEEDWPRNDVWRRPTQSKTNSGSWEAERCWNSLGVQPEKAAKLRHEQDVLLAWCIEVEPYY